MSADVPGLLTRLSSVALEDATVSGLILDHTMGRHFDPDDDEHPECPERLVSIESALKEAGLYDRFRLIPPREVTDSELGYVHTASHVEACRRLMDASLTQDDLNKASGSYNSVYINKDSVECALLSAGSCVEMTEQIVKGKIKSGMAIVRPPGHHAEAHRAMGFCFFNNVAVAAAVAVHTLGLDRVLILDWDVHHGNGTQLMFEEDPRVMYVSLHRYESGSFYPGGKLGSPLNIGKGAGKGYNINVGWERPRQGDREYAAAFDRVIMPIAREYRPQLVLISAGFDAALGDPLGGCTVTPAGYAYMMKELMSLAGGRVLLALEGGYNLESISASAVACARIMLDGPDAISTAAVVSGEPRADAAADINTTILALSQVWTSLPTIKRSSARIAAAKSASTTPPTTPRSSTRSAAPQPSRTAPPISTTRGGGAAAGIASTSSTATTEAVGAAASAPSTPTMGSAAALNSAAAAELTAETDRGGAVTVLSTCPHVADVIRSQLDVSRVDLFDGTEAAPCADCSSKEENWMCLHCGAVRCSRYIQAHASAHAAGEGHPMCLSLRDFNTWCSVCEHYVHSSQLQHFPIAVAGQRFPV